MASYCLYVHRYNRDIGTRATAGTEGSGTSIRDKICVIEMRCECISAHLICLARPPKLQSRHLTAAGQS